jgi:hypothetical protein
VSHATFDFGRPRPDRPGRPARPAAARTYDDVPSPPRRTAEDEARLQKIREHWDPDRQVLCVDPAAPDLGEFMAFPEDAAEYGWLRVLPDGRHVPAGDSAPDLPRSGPSSDVLTTPEPAAEAPAADPFAGGCPSPVLPFRCDEWRL